MSLVKYYIDGSSLSAEDMQKVSDLVEGTAFMYDLIPGRPCTYEAMWNKAINPTADINFPDNCLIKRLT